MQPVPLTDDAKSSWTYRRRIVFSTLIFCAFTTAYLVTWAPSDALRENLSLGILSLAGMVISAYVFGAVWDDANLLKAKTQVTTSGYGGVGGIPGLGGIGNGMGLGLTTGPSSPATPGAPPVLPAAPVAPNGLATRKKGTPQNPAAIKPPEPPTNAAMELHDHDGRGMTEG